MPKDDKNKKAPDNEQVSVSQKETIFRDNLNKFVDLASFVNWYP